MIELCPRCGKNLALVGYMHLCAPLLTHAPKAKAVTENRVTKNPPPPVTKIQEVTSSHMHRRVRKQATQCIQAANSDCRAASSCP
jgi:hypothetical protein